MVLHRVLSKPNTCGEEYRLGPLPVPREEGIFLRKGRWRLPRKRTYSAATPGVNFCKLGISIHVLSCYILPFNSLLLRRGKHLHMLPVCEAGSPAR